MPKSPYDLPSLTMLRSFEAAARLGSFADAASELNVTPSAISHQVKALERELSCPLFDRGHRQVRLTPEGYALAGDLRRGLSTMSDGVRMLRQMSAPEQVSISATTAMSSFYLTPRILAFWNDHPDITVNQQLSDRRLPRPLRVDLAIEYRELPPDEPDHTLLFHDELVPVCAPDFRATNRPLGLSELAEAPLIHLDAPDRNWTTWQSWFRQLGHTDPIATGRKVNTYFIALQMAREGAGIALGWRRMIAPLLSAGDLIEISDQSCAAPGAFYLIPRPGFRSEAAKQLAVHLIANR